MKKRETTNGYRFLSRVIKMSWNQIVVMVTWSCEYIRYLWIVYFKKMSSVIYEFIAIKNV